MVFLGLALLVLSSGNQQLSMHVIRRSFLLLLPNPRSFLSEIRRLVDADFSGTLQYDVSFARM